MIIEHLIGKQVKLRQIKLRDVGIPETNPYGIRYQQPTIGFRPEGNEEAGQQTGASCVLQTDCFSDSLPSVVVHRFHGTGLLTME